LLKVFHKLISVSAGCTNDIEENKEGQKGEKKQVFGKMLPSNFLKQLSS